MNLFGWCLTWASWIFGLISLQALDLERCRISTLGMESNQIRDQQITASSSFDLQSVGPQNGRIRTEKASGAWCPKQQIRNDSYEFLQVNFNYNIAFRGIETQGRYGNGTGREYAEKYFIDYWRMGNQWIRYRNRSGHQLMDGNENTEEAVLRLLDPPVIASKIRIVPFSSVTRTTCLRMELYGCTYSDGLLAYSLSKPTTANLSDFILEETHLQDNSGNKKGLGLLTDGYVAVDSPTSSSLLNASWLGWTQKSTNGRVDVLFEFDNARRFSGLKMFTFGQTPDKIVVDLYELDITNGEEAKSTRITQTFDSSSSGSLTVIRVPLQGDIAKHVRATIIFSATWFYLTEVQFEEGDSAAVSPTKSTKNISDNESQRLEVYYFIVFFLLAVFLLLVIYFCILYLVKRVRSNHKLGTKSARNSFYSKPGVLITTLGGDGAPKQVLQSLPNFLPISHSQDFPEELKSNLYATVNEFGGQKQRMLGHKSHAFSYTTSLSRSGEESNTSPSLLNFNFPPPPTSSSTTSEEIVYAEPCVNAPLLPYPLKTSASASFVLTNSKSHFRKPVPKPRSFRDFRNRTLPSRATKNLTSKINCPSDENINILQEDSTTGEDSCQLALSRSSIELVEKIDEGKFTHIYKCKLPGMDINRKFVLKTAKPEYANDLTARKALMAEVEVMRRLSHNPLFVKLIHQCDDFSLLTECISQGNLRSAIKNNPSNFNFNTLIHLCTSIAAAMKYLETNNIVHGHFSPRSCLLDANFNVKIASPRGSNLHAQLRYSAPEAIILDTWSSKTDVWSFAITCWELLNLCVELPFSKMSNAQIVENCQSILQGSPNAVYLHFHNDFISKEVAELLKDCWNADSSLRPTFLEIQLFFMRKDMNSDM